MDYCGGGGGDQMQISICIYVSFTHVQTSHAYARLNLFTRVFLQLGHISMI